MSTKLSTFSIPKENLASIFDTLITSPLQIYQEHFSLPVYSNGNLTPLLYYTLSITIESLEVVSDQSDKPSLKIKGVVYLGPVSKQFTKTLPFKLNMNSQNHIELVPENLQMLISSTILGFKQQQNIKLPLSSVVLTIPIPAGFSGKILGKFSKSTSRSYRGTPAPKFDGKSLLIDIEYS